MKTKQFAWLLAVIFLLGTARIATAQGTAITYQGTLTSATNTANGAFDFTFQLFNASSGGTQIGPSLTNSAVAVSNGQFLVTLDFGTVFKGTNYWLALNVRTNGTGTFNPLSPRQPITPAPYAITAVNLSGVVENNTLGSSTATVGGGTANSATGYYSTIGGGNLNIAYNTYSTAGGGFQNTSSGYAGTVSGGYTNIASGQYSTVSGGLGNTASGTFSTVGGGNQNIANSNYSTVSGGLANTSSGSTSAVGGGYSNVASGLYATISGGTVNTASGQYSTVAGGRANIASGDFSFAGGNGAQALYQGSFVWADDNGGSFAATAANQFAVRALNGVLLAANVQMGTSSADYRHFQLGGGNSTGFLYGSYPAFGDGVHLGYNYYADSAGTGHVSNSGGATSRISAGYGQVLLAIGGVNATPNTSRLLANSTGVTVYGTFNNSSDREVKQDFTPVNPSDILARLLALPITEWSYKTDATTRHIGPVAQDFYSVFNVGTDDKHIAPIDEGGVAFTAIKGLNQKLEEQTRKLNDQLKAKDKEIEELNARLKRIETLLAPESNVR